MKRHTATVLATGFAGLVAGTTPAQAQDELTLCWAAWDPANALVELSKDFTAESGIGMKFEFVPWTNFADRFLNELNSGGKLCDLLIGDSQWLGGSADLRPLHQAERLLRRRKASRWMISCRPRFMPTRPGRRASPNYWALPAMGDALGWVYRKDWFARPELQAEFKEKYGRALDVPKTWTEVKRHR